MALSMIPIPPDAKRDAKARELVKGWRLWPVKTLKHDTGAFKRGDQFFVINGHDTSAVYCSCPDYQKRGAICGHIRAVVLLDQQSVTRPVSPNLAGVRGYLEAVVGGADHEQAREDGHRARLRYEQIWQED